MTTRMDEWRARAFTKIAKEVCNPWLFGAQGLLKLWFPDSTKLDGLEIKAITDVLSTLQMIVPIGDGPDEQITLYLYVVYGELRFGVKVAKSLLTDRFQDNVRDVLPGAKSFILDAAGNDFFCDFIFRDEWVAKTDVMARLLTDAAMDEMFVDTVSKTCQHIIVSSLRNLLFSNRAAHI